MPHDDEYDHARREACNKWYLAAQQAMTALEVLADGHEPSDLRRYTQRILAKARHHADAAERAERRQVELLGAAATPARVEPAETTRALLRSAAE
jgi:hypothetical protein